MGSKRGTQLHLYSKVIYPPPWHCRILDCVLCGFFSKTSSELFVGLPASLLRFPLNFIFSNAMLTHPRLSVNPQKLYTRNRKSILCWTPSLTSITVAFGISPTPTSPNSRFYIKPYISDWSLAVRGCFWNKCFPVAYICMLFGRFCIHYRDSLLERKVGFYGMVKRGIDTGKLAVQRCERS